MFNIPDFPSAVCEHNDLHAPNICQWYNFIEIAYYKIAVLFFFIRLSCNTSHILKCQHVKITTTEEMHRPHGWRFGEV